MNNYVEFDPELQQAVEDGNVLTKKILDSIEIYKNQDEKARALKLSLRQFEVPDKNDNAEDIEIRSKVVSLALDEQSNIRMRVYYPESSEKMLPCLYHIHGGGMIVGDIENNRINLLKLSEELKAVIVDVDYRLAPEYPYPHGVNDCYAGLKWVMEHSGELGVDHSMVGLYGESAGGGLVAATALKARDFGGPPVKFQAMIAPMLDDRNDTPSSGLCSGVWPSWPREMNVLAWRALLGEIAGSNRVSKYAAPSRAEDLRDLPPAYIEVGELEVFRDEDVSYAQKLMQYNVPVELYVYPGTFHSWYAHAPEATFSRRAVRSRLEWIRKQFQS